MARSTKKVRSLTSVVGRITKMNQAGEKRVLKTWARRCVRRRWRDTLAVHNGKQFIPVYITENMVGHKMGEFFTRQFRGHHEDQGRKVGRRASKPEDESWTRTHFQTCRHPPRKVRQLADLVRGQKVDSALTMLRFTKRAASEAVSKTIQSAMHNLVNKHGASVAAEDMLVKAIIIEEGATMYRIRPRAQGRAYRIGSAAAISAWVTLMEEQASMKNGQHHQTAKPRKRPPLGAK